MSASRYGLVNPEYVQQQSSIHMLFHGSAQIKEHTGPSAALLHILTLRCKLANSCQASILLRLPKLKLPPERRTERPGTWL